MVWFGLDISRGTVSSIVAENKLKGAIRVFEVSIKIVLLVPNSPLWLKPPSQHNRQGVSDQIDEFLTLKSQASVVVVF